MLKYMLALAALVNATPAQARPHTFTLQVEAQGRAQPVVMRRHMTADQCGRRAMQIVHAYPYGEVVCVPERLLVGYDCETGPGPLFADEEDEFPRCKRIERR